MSGSTRGVLPTRRRPLELNMSMPTLNSRRGCLPSIPERLHHRTSPLTPPYWQHPHIYALPLRSSPRNQLVAFSCSSPDPL
eukprot:4120828-Pleurochrysis_carterae.AAC.1